MKERSTLSIFSSFWYASWVGFLTWKKAKQFVQTHPVENLSSETNIKSPNVLAACHQPLCPALSTTTLPHPSRLRMDWNTYIHTGPTFPPLSLCSRYTLHLECSPHFSMANCDPLLALPPKGLLQFSLFPSCHQSPHHVPPKAASPLFSKPPTKNLNCVHTVVFLLLSISSQVDAKLLGRLV